ncbi:DUF4861 family protein [Hyunsoonleella ulvae]|uniref:DUF4861 family protein n=1 Tax=Hyunsoonleella ulvae TaxID=2799948 RepID=UPI00193A5E0E|nr:DUF4861 family protein [Hyunsoonleella ulvae]
MKTTPIFALLTLCLAFFNCKSESGQIVTVKNTLDISRSFETVEINVSDIILSQDESIEGIGVVDVETGNVLVSQLIDEDQDGSADALLFQTDIDANSEKRFKLLQVEASSRPDVKEYCYSRFVPERTDDYAWENNKVAFRTFGPVAQKMKEDGVKGGTLSSGIDAWLKRVEYPIINKWYKRNDEKLGAYHYDIGEGLDNFHVGVSRGVGGLAAKIDTTYYVSKNFTKWTTIATGPIRTSFILEYANWNANGSPISETKHISLDYGSNLSKFEVELSGVETIYAGLTLHEKDGNDTQNTKAGYISYWEPHGDSELGTAIVVPNGNMISSELFDTPVKDWSNLYANIKIDEGKVVYYAGFGWKKAKEFTTEATWNNYLETFAKKANNPLVVTLK